MRSTEIAIDTGAHRVVDVTGIATSFLDSGDEGLLHLFAPHATCGLALMETGSGSEADLLATVERLLPRDNRYRHRHGSGGHGADHVLPAFVSPSLTLPVQRGQILLGTWQSVVLVDTNDDNPHRRLRLSLLAG
ncbi:MAG: YjbQ family protein [Candidatus Dormibacteria bacterium]